MKVKIIAEAGVNHNGDIFLAKKLIDAAVIAGADYVKFQTFKADKLVDKSAKKAKYQEESTGSGSQYDMLKQLELSDNDHRELKRYCEDNKISFLSTAFDVDSLIFLVEEMNIDLIKIPSGEMNNYFLLKKVAEYNMETVMSTGMCDMTDIRKSYDFLLENGLEKENLTILHCTTAYPTPFDEVNLKAITSIEKEFNCKVGYSDHTSGIEVSVASIAFGSTLIEKHFTLDKEMDGPDHKASLNPEELKNLVSGVRNVAIAMGSPIKQASLTEELNKEVARKSLFYNDNLMEGTILSESHFIAKRPGTGINPLDLTLILGKKLVNSVHKNSMAKSIDYV